MTTNQPWRWPQETGALLAAPASHRVILENNQVWVLDVVIEPGAREPEHTHQAPNVMIIDSPARIRYYAGGTLQFESQARPASPSGPRVRCMEPEGPHSVENIDQHRSTPSASNSSSTGPRTQLLSTITLSGSHVIAARNGEHHITAPGSKRKRRAP